MRTFDRYDENTGKAEVVIFDDGVVGRGLAYLHEDDREFGNKSTGVSIAHYRALASVYYKKAMKEYDVIIFLKNRYKQSHFSEKYYQMIEDRAERYLKKAMEYSYIAEDVIETKDMFYRRMEGIRSGEISTMQFMGDLSEVLSEDFKKAIDEGMSMPVEDIQLDDEE